MEYPSIYSFPPFFTIQPNTDSWLKQQEMWIDLILAFQRHNQSFILNTDPTAEPFTNKSINRKIRRLIVGTFGREGIALIIKQMIESKQAEYIDGRCYIFWKTLQALTDEMLLHVQSTGKVGSICTFYELINESPIKGIDETILKKIIGKIAKDGKAIVFGSDGVKFI